MKKLIADFHQWCLVHPALSTLLWMVIGPILFVSLLAAVPVIAIYGLGYESRRAFLERNDVDGIL